MKAKPKKQSLRATTLRGQPPRESYTGLAPDLADHRPIKKSDMPRREHNQP